MRRPCLHLLLCAAVTGLCQPAAGVPDAAPPDVVTLDVTEHWTHVSRGQARQVAMPIPVDLELNDGVQSELADGTTRRRFTVDSPGARFMSFKCSGFDFAAGVTMRVASRDQSFVVGPFTHRHTKETRRFGSPIVPGDRMVIEIDVPRGVADPIFTVESVSHGFRNAFGTGAILDDGDITGAAFEGPPAFAGGGPFGCETDVVCPEGTPFADVAHAMAEGYDGQFVCSGQLVNNAEQDGRLLYLTAAHCEWWQDPSTMVYYWDYANETCGGNDFPAFTFSTGSSNLFYSTGSVNDIHLLELDDTDLEASFDVYFAGWNRSATPPSTSATLGFPDDKPLKVAIDFDPADDCSAASCPNGFGSPFWRIDDWEVGTTQGGSSGGALLDQDQRVVGVLTGGVGTNCNNFGWDEFFKLSEEWVSLQPFLDPNGTGVMAIDGWDGQSIPCPGDVDVDGMVGFSDLVAILSAWGSGSAAADLDGNGIVDFSDLVAVLSSWGDCF